jgi:surface antigen
VALCALCVLAGVALAGSEANDPDVWPVAAGDPMESYLDHSLFDGGNLPAGIAAVLDCQGELAIVRISRIEGLVDESCHLLDFAAGKAYHIRPFHVITSAQFSPQRTRMAAVISEPFDHAIMIYTIADGEGRCLASIQAVAGSVAWLDEGRIQYLPWVNGAPGSQQIVVDLSTAEYVPRATCPAGGGQVVPTVYSCGGTNDDFNCGGNNPYPCCSNGGNCTWWCWDRACRNWVRALPGWGDAHSWYGYAQAAGYPTGTTPQVGSIAVDTNYTFGAYGHVVWVLSYTSTTLTVSEQNCGGGYGDRVYTWNRSAFDGYIYNPTPSAPTITQHPSSQSVCSGAGTTFTVAASGSGTLSYQWQKNSSNITNGGHYDDCTTATLTVSGCSSGDVANYRCVVSNSNGSTPSNQASLSLKTATAITQQPSNKAVSLGQTAQFTLGGTGDGTLYYQWQKNGSNVTNGGHYSGCTSATLTVSSCNTSDVGSYLCTLTAGCGSVISNTASLRVGQPGDFDVDGDVDVEDFGVLQGCLGGAPTSTCAPSDLNFDSGVNYTDVSRFVGCMSGSSIPANAGCLP